jgi:hypothetical protein
MARPDLTPGGGATQKDTTVARPNEPKVDDRMTFGEAVKLARELHIQVSGGGPGKWHFTDGKVFI